MGDFNIHITKCFKDGAFHQKSKIYDVLTFKPLVPLVGLPKAFSIIASHVNISWRGRVFWPTKGTGGLQHDIVLIFDGKQHPKNI